MRIFISTVLLIIGFQLIIHSFNYEPILGLSTIIIIATIIYFIIKPIFKKQNEKAN